MCAMATILFLGGWLPPFRRGAVHLDPGRDLVHAQMLLHVLHVRDGEGDRSALTATTSSCGWAGRSSCRCRSPWSRSSRASCNTAGSRRNDRGNGMIDLSLAGLLGAVVGTVVAALAYGPLVAVIERAFRRAVSRRPRRSTRRSPRRFPCCAGRCWGRISSCSAASATGSAGPSGAD